MALDTFIPGDNPIWYFVNLNGKPLAGGLFNTYSNLNNNLRKPVYTSPDENFPFPNPAIINSNGTLGPIYFGFDSTLDPPEGYLIIVTDALGNIIWTVDDYFGNGGSGGGGGTTTIVLGSKNLVTNGVMWRHAQDISPVQTYQVIAPSLHENLVTQNTGISNPFPDIVFLKNNATSTDSISFVTLLPGEVLVTPGVAPIDYMRYECLISGSENNKFLQFPITAKVNSLQNVQVVGSFWARSNSGANQLTLRWFQYYGDGAGATIIGIPPVITTVILDGTWKRYNFSSTIPTTSGNNLGNPSGPNDGLFVRVNFPLGVTSIDFTNFSMYLGNNTQALPDLEFNNYDSIEAVVNAPRTGDVRFSLNSFVPFGWVPCNDGVISSGSVATNPPANIPVARRNVDTYPLYVLIWNLTTNFPELAPIYTNAGVATTRGATVIDDFSAGKQLKLTRMLGRVLAGANPNLTQNTTFNANPVPDTITVLNPSFYPTGTPVYLNSTGTLPAPLATLNDPNVYYTIFTSPATLRLARSLELAQAGTFINITDAGTGTHHIKSADGSYYGASIDTLILSDLPGNNGPSGLQVKAFNGPASGPPFNSVIGSTTLGSAPVDVINPVSQTSLDYTQPTAFLNIMLKL